MDFELFASADLYAAGKIPARTTGPDGQPLEPVRRGQWVIVGLSERDKALAAVFAAAANALGSVTFSHESAALLWGLPVLRTPDRIHEVVGPAGSGSSRGIFRHRSEIHPDEVVVTRGQSLTSIPRTIVDISGTSARPLDGVAMLDHALRRGLTTLDEVNQSLGLLRSKRGKARAARVIALADPGAESVGESLSRMAMFSAGLARPVLQQAFEDDNGPIGRTDFCWKSVRVIGEFDGKVKYGSTYNADHKASTERLIAEKLREDRLRALGWKVVRWTWADAARGTPMVEALRAAGVPSAARRTWLDR